ncbi:hypothetical protein P7K49_023133 [Saguinus oedipus]|uniref:Uncharacterized protein n=1 Tax=Saguinus oedipus TaxID=9490 RepID=A0ABQ9UKQ9_SAGOE|nr:hypothetical protein P7K49_023133 [Saguinus oedipus]
MADEDLIFRLEGVDGGPRAGHDGGSDGDSDDEEGYFICPITDDPSSNQNVNSKVNKYCSNLTKSERYGSSGSPANSFHVKPRVLAGVTLGQAAPEIALGVSSGVGGPKGAGFHSSCFPSKGSFEMSTQPREGSSSVRERG